ncbi:oxygenase MpaB family protein [Luteimonas sp. RD2P54]|uniref:Oxygenase MpaB family protein n=1 Tax=Luteimonas endophytica TaxID=3042023 RepID=A0ABT6JAF7_9GAMM|nr:oxygenase MpaB family protein [Luteimonas endophytica]MDH5823810.1 oxygenase MpaB family protein [Luteimonas endophytica]
MPPPHHPFTAVAASRIRGWVLSAFPRGQSGRDVPGSHAGVEDYFARMRPQLACDARSREVLAVLERIHLPVPAAGLSRELFLGAGAALLPGWARHMLGRSPARRLRDALAARTLAGLAPLFRAALDDGVAPRACARVGVDPAILHAMPGAARAPAADRR